MAELLHFLRDDRVGCDSILIEMQVEKFLELAAAAYTEKGGLEGQRAALRTKTAKTIRNRLVDDLQKGAVVPPIVLGAIVDKTEREKFAKATTSQEVVELLAGLLPVLRTPS